MQARASNKLDKDNEQKYLSNIKAAEKEPNLGGAALGRVGPVTEGLLVWTLGLGLLIGIAVWLTMKAK